MQAIDPDEMRAFRSYEDATGQWLPTDPLRSPFRVLNVHMWESTFSEARQALTT